MGFAEVIAVLGAVPGVLALLGLVAGYIRLGMRVKVLEDQMQKLIEVPAQLARIEERVQTARDAATRIEGKMDNFLSVLIGEARSFREAIEDARRPR